MQSESQLRIWSTINHIQIIIICLMLISGGHDIRHYGGEEQSCSKCYGLCAYYHSPRAVHLCAQAERSAAHTETAAYYGSRGRGAKAAIVERTLYLYADADRRLISTARFMYMDAAGRGNDPPEAERLLRISLRTS